MLMNSTSGDFSRKIIHIDADAFYASVEIRENPSYIGKPIAVGGAVSKRGVIAASSYEARAYGVRSAMSSSKAMELCPGLLIVPPRFNLYRRVSKEMHEIFRNYTQLIEPLSLDEAYLDVSEATHFDGSASRIAFDIRRKVRDLLKITVSAGIAPNKFLAKVASDWNKPDDQFTITPEEIPSFILNLPVEKINGVGYVTAKKLADMGVRKCGDLQKIEIMDLVKRFGTYGSRLANLAIGLDNRPVQATRPRRREASARSTRARRSPVRSPAAVGPSHSPRTTDGCPTTGTRHARPGHAAWPWPDTPIRETQPRPDRRPQEGSGRSAGRRQPRSVT